jgi:hypothetical protein
MGMGGFGGGLGGEKDCAEFLECGRCGVKAWTVGCGKCGGVGRVEIKTRNLRRDPRAVLCVLSDDFFGRWIRIEGTARIVSLPEAMERLVDYYRRISGEHP